jgi:MFS family permease
MSNCTDVLGQQVFWLIPPFLTYTLAFGGIIVPKLNLILTLICSEYLPEQALTDPNFQFMPVIFGDDNPQCQIPEVQARVARFILYGSMIAGILSAVTSPKLGVLSDRYGRVKILVITTFGTLVGEVITITAATHPETVSYRWLLLGYASEGICGSFIAAMAISNAYAADCTEPSRRAVTFAYLYGCLFTGIAIGPIAAGYIVKLSGQLVTVFFVALGAHIFFLAFLIFLIPESLTMERMLSARQKPEVVGGDVAWTWRHSMRRLSYAAGFSTRDPEDGPLESWRDSLSQLVHVLPWLRRGGGLLSPLSVLWPSGPGSSAAVRRNLVMLAAVDTVMFGVAMGSMTIVVLYSEYMFGWGNFESSRFLSIVNTSRVSILIIVLPLVTRLVRGPRSTYVSKNSGSDQLDLALIRTAIAFDIIGYVGFAASQSGNMLIASGVIASIGGMGSPTLASSMTKHVPAERTGQLLGAVGLLHALARVVAPTLFNLIYAETVVRGKPQIVFICLAATFGVAFIMSWFIRPHGRLLLPSLLGYS